MEYFAYGSNLCVPRLVKRGADPSNPRIARLADHELRFNKRSVDSTKANIVASVGSEVWGVVFTISDNRLSGLRDAEGCPDHYYEQTVNLTIEGTEQQAVAYIACLGKITDSGSPFSWYLNHIVRGAKKFDFPENYIANLEGVNSISDANTKRDKEERAFWI